MFRVFLLGTVMCLLAACSLNPMRGGGQNVKIVGESDYCGTSSQDSNALYFADADAFGDWIAYRSITEFKPSMARDNGVLVVEMGQRPTGGYNIKVDRGKTHIDNGTLTLGMEWNAPRLDAAVSQALIASCVAIEPPKGEYQRVQVVDQLGNVRGTARIR